MTTIDLCTFPGCGRALLRQGLCAGHTRQRQRGIELKPLRGKAPKIVKCADPSCGRAAYARGYCPSHGKQAAKHGKTAPLGKPHDIVTNLRKKQPAELPPG